jgi:hypothetical protein
MAGSELRPLEVERFVAEAELPAGKPGVAPELARVPWRQGSMRVLVSDLLFPGAPDGVLSALGGGRARGVVLAPYGALEATPDWNGNLELRDCESGAQRLQRVSPELLAEYRAAYQRHFALWRERARRHAAWMARVPAEPALRDALQGEALAVGAVELG